MNETDRARTSEKIAAIRDSNSKYYLIPSDRPLPSVVTWSVLSACPYRSHDPIGLVI